MDLPFCYQKCNIFIPKPPWRTSSLQEKLQENIQHFKTLKFLNFCGSYLPPWFGIRISDADPDPQHCLKLPDSFRRRRWSTRWRATPCPSAPSPSARTRKSFSQVNTALKSQMCQWFDWLIDWLIDCGSFRSFIVAVLYSTLLHLAPLRLHCVGGCWD